MIVLPDSYVDYKSLIKKTHKGYFQVDVEEDYLTPKLFDGGGFQLQYKQHHTQTNEVPNVDEVTGLVDILDHSVIGSGADSPGAFPSGTSSGKNFK